MVDGSKVVEAGDVVERKPAGPDEPVGAFEGASAATPEEAPGTVVTESRWSAGL